MEMTDKTYANWKSWRPADFGTPTDASRAYFKKLWRQFVGRSRQPQNILEIGYGNGQFLGWCRQQGHRVTGVETNKDLLTRARKAGFDSQPSIDEVADAGFDLIVLFDVLEHVPEAGLPAYFQMLRDRLLTGGQIILRTPNGGSPLGLNNQHGDPTHVAILTRNKLKYLALVFYCNKISRFFWLSGYKSLTRFITAYSASRNFRRLSRANADNSSWLLSRRDLFSC